MGVEVVMRGRISVAMATYNGEKYIREQVASILPQLRDYDEIIVSDDGSKDGTLTVLDSFHDDRIKVIEGPGRGVKANFNNAMEHCVGDYIFLSDQDDIWAPNKVDICLEALKKHDLVVHDAWVFDSEIKTILFDSFYSTKNSGRGCLKNIIKNTYIGCCMCFSRRLLESSLPIPDNIEMHDQWIGVINDIEYKNTVFIPEKLIKYRI